MFWFAVLLLVLLTFIFQIFFRTRRIWDEKNVPHEKPWPIFGNMAKVAFRRIAFAQLVQDSYNKFSNERYYGFYLFRNPTLVIRDPDLIKEIVIKEADNFRDHLDFLPETSDAFWNKNLFALKGQEWHDMRIILSPLFTGSKMRMMFLFMMECAQKYIKHLKTSSNNSILEVEMKDVVLGFANDVIASTAYGIELNSIEDKENEFYRLGKSAFNLTGLRGLKMFGASISPKLMEILGIQLLDINFQNFFKKLVNDTIAFREETGYIRPDMIHFLREAQKGRSIVDDDQNLPDAGFAAVSENRNTTVANSKTEITNDDIAAQASVFFFGGFDSVGMVIAHMAHELAVNPNVQEKLIREVDETLEECNGKITYEMLVQMKYLDMVVTESLRLWSPAPLLFRRCIRSYTIQPKLPGEKPLILEKGSDVAIPFRGIHRDPKYYQDPEKFDPERFSPENKHKLLPGTYMPFGGGQRSCIASRFALVECKVMIFSLLSEFEIVPVQRTHIPMVLDKKQVIVGSEYGYWLGLKPRKR